MLVRIVRMEFDPARVEEFLQLFARVRDRIRAFPGCEALQLHRDAAQPNVLYTLSHWRSPDHLEAYRNSELFASTWADTKALFGGRPQAFSLQQVQDVG